MTSAKAKAYWQLMRMDKPIGSLLLLWPTLWALILAAEGIPDLHVLVVF
jgi:4-hydroxybenzoate polyprenyltransferase